MKLAFVSLLDIAPWGGSETLWSETAKLALEQNHEVFTSTYFWEEKPEVITKLSYSGAQTHFRKGYNPAVAVRLYRRLRNGILKESSEVKALKKFDPDIIIVNQAGAFDVLHNAELVAYMLTTSKPYVVLCHNYEEGLVLSEGERNRVVKLFGKAKSVFMICKSQADTIMKQLVHKLSNIGIIENPVNLKEIKPTALPPLSNIQFASVASLHVDRKGQDIALEVLGMEKWKNRNWQFNIYGTGPHKKYLEQLVDYFGLREKVAFKGHVKDINALWKENHLLLLSSRIETGPMVLTEAMLCGRPVVATRVGKVPELLQDGCNGYVADAPTVMLFDAALERAWQNKEAWAAIGSNAYESALAAIDLQATENFFEFLVDTK